MPWWSEHLAFANQCGQAFRARDLICLPSLHPMAGRAEPRLRVVCFEWLTTPITLEVSQHTMLVHVG